jgi:hypothetical protein
LDFPKGLKLIHYHCPGFDFPPLTTAPEIKPAADQRRRCLSPAHKIKSIQQKRGEFFAARPAGLISGNSGMSGSPSFGYFSWRDKKSN